MLYCDSYLVRPTSLLAHFGPSLLGRPWPAELIWVIRLYICERKRLEGDRLTKAHIWSIFVVKRDEKRVKWLPIRSPVCDGHR